MATKLVLHHAAMMWFTITLASVSLCLVFSQSDGPHVQTSKGVVVGLTVNHTGTTGVEYKAFIGIPYGDPPVRFQLPKPRAAWSGPLYTQTDGPACPQQNTSSAWLQEDYSEDCLYLNVYIPQNANADSKLPVMVFIHGGVWTFGSSSSKVYAPDFLINSGVIVVTMNYRLGAIGFLTLGTPAAPGNLGLHDTLLALCWTQQEIAAFGGDPSQVTLTGHSAGSMAVQYHYISPLSAGVGSLFNKGIAQSGPALADCCHVSVTEGVKRAHLLAAALGCNITAGNVAILDCLQKANIHELVGNQTIPMSLGDNILAYNNAFMPVLDDSSTADLPFFNKSLETLTREASNRSIPLLMGLTRDEGVTAIGDSEYWKMAESHLDVFIPKSVSPSLSEEKKTSMATNIRNHFFHDSPEENKIADLVRLYSDSLFAYAIMKTARYYSNFTYGYLFAYDGTWRQPQPYFSQFRLSGAVAHADELAYLWYGSSSNQYLDNCRENSANLEMRDLLVQLWTDFVKSGNPSNASISWKVLGESNNYLVINSVLSTMNTSRMEEQHYNFWAALEASALSSSDTNRFNVFWLSTLPFLALSLRSP